MTFPVIPSGVRRCIMETARTEKSVHTSWPAQKEAVSRIKAGMLPKGSAKAAAAGSSARPKAQMSRSQRRSLGPSMPAAMAPSTAAAASALSAAP